MHVTTRSTADNRRGGTMVETAIVLSAFFVFVLGIIEMSRLGMVSQLITNAAREGCRVAVLAGKTNDDVNATIQTLLNSGGIYTYTLPPPTPPDVTTIPFGEPVTVTIQVAYSDVGWLSTPRFLGSAIITSSATLSSERP
jgi:Flp pilus assembly protein TadG